MTTRDTERLEVRAVLGEADDSCVIQQSAALEVEDLETCAMGEEVTKHCKKGRGREVEYYY